MPVDIVCVCQSNLPLACVATSEYQVMCYSETIELGDMLIAFNYMLRSEMAFYFMICVW